VSVASTKFTSAYVNALTKEMKLSQNLIDPASFVETVYFGGGTPSLLSIDEVKFILHALHSTFQIANDAEITFEMNPDDANREYLMQLSQMGINRLSIGTQSFHDNELSFLGRRHDAKTSEMSFLLAREVGFTNISVDIIFGMPHQIAGDAQHNINKLFSLQPEHISAYGLTMEPNTAFHVKVKKGQMHPPSEDLSLLHFNMYMNCLQQAGYEHYEISNYAKPGFRSKHNSSYWNGSLYLGLGAGAHSYDGKKRWWNTGIISSYINSIESNSPKREEEVLTKNDLYNDYILTSIRTSDGVSLKHIQQTHGEDFAAHFLRQVIGCLDKEYVVSQQSVYILTDTGKIMADSVAADLMI
jgi:oxygen-independent coproporphyrinogen III oxidase